MKFPRMITGFVLDIMHLLDGGVIEDWLEAFMGALKKKDDRFQHDKEMPQTIGYLRSMVHDINARVKLLSRFRMLEQSRPLRYYILILLFLLNK